MAAMDLFLGPILLGIILNIWLYGIMVTQTAIYYVSFPRDQKWLKIMVTGIFITDTLNSIFDVGIVWRYLITLFGDLPGVMKSHWLFNIEPLMTVMISSTAQCFFAWRIAKLTGQNWLGWLLAFFSLIQFLCGTASTIGAFIINDFVHFDKLKLPIGIWLGLSVVTDILITGIVSWYLLTHRTGISSTDDIISRIVRLTVQNGLITTVWTTLNLITFLTQDKTGSLYLFFQMPLCKLYSNTVLSTLNCRAGWGIGLGSSTGGPSSQSGGITGRSEPTVWNHDHTKAQTTIQVVTTATVNRDDGVELQSYSMGDTKSFSPGDIEPGRHTEPTATVRLTGVTSATGHSDATSIHSRPSLDAK